MLEAFLRDQVAKLFMQLSSDTLKKCLSAFTMTPKQRYFAREQNARNIVTLLQKKSTREINHNCCSYFTVLIHRQLPCLTYLRCASFEAARNAPSRPDFNLLGQTL